MFKGRILTLTASLRHTLNHEKESVDERHTPEAQLQKLIQMAADFYNIVIEATVV